MKTLTLDYSKWRSGGGFKTSHNQLGIGPTALHNELGFQCCLGQFSLQLGKCSIEDILNKTMPDDLKKKIRLLNKSIGDNNYVNTIFSNKAVAINDDMDTTPSQKITLLRKLLKTKGLLLRVINRPKK